MLERVGVPIVEDSGDDKRANLVNRACGRTADVPGRYRSRFCTGALPHGLSTAPFTVDHAHANGYPVATAPGSVPKQFFCFHTASNFLERAGTMTKFLVLFNQTRRERR